MRALVVCHLLLVLFASVKAEHFKRIPINKGQINRNLESNSSVAFNTSYLPNYVVPVEFDNAYTKKNNIVDPTNMILVISSNETALTTTCTQFTAYQPSDALTNTTNNFTSPFVSAANISSDYATVSLVNNQWQLKNKAVFLKNCDVSPYYITEKATYGLIGLGLDGDGVHNYIGDVVFTIEVDGTGNGSLVFGNDSSLAPTGQESLMLAASNNWEIDVNELIFYNTIQADVKLIFDLQVESILLPDIYLTQFKATLGGNSVWNCTNNNCTYNGNVAEVPNLVINTEEGLNYTIDSSLFMNGNNLNIQTYNGSYTNYSADYIVLGWKILANQYTVFEKQPDNPVIGIYRKNPIVVAAPVETPTSHTGLIIISIIVVLVVGAVAYLTFIRKRRLTQHASVQRHNISTEMRSDISKSNVSAVNSLRL